jgi:hypothetical protein
MFVVSRTPLYAGRSLLIVAITAAFSVSASEANPPPKTPSAGSAQEGGGRVPEAAERVAIGETIRSQLPSLQECYGRRLEKTPLLQGKLMLRFEIEPDGSVVRASGEGINDPMLLSCILGNVAKWQFAKPLSGAVLKVAYPVVFKSA